ncbi:hypothetical protein [Bounagaea algeriensis]
MATASTNTSGTKPGKKPGAAKPAGAYAAEARARKVPLPDGLDPATVGAAAALFVYQYRTQHQTGPTWREVAEYVHPDCVTVCGPQADRADRVVPRVHAEQIVQQLIDAGWLSVTREKRSLTLAGAH